VVPIRDLSASFRWRYSVRKKMMRVQELHHLHAEDGRYLVQEQGLVQNSYE
jgi:hypothetical protein